MKSPIFLPVLLALGALGLQGCGGRSPLAAPDELRAPASWLVPVLSHRGDTQDLSSWWARWNDPVLQDWIEQAQQHSPSLADAHSRVVQARAQRLAQEALHGPQLGALVAASRAQDRQLAFSSSLSGGLEASWTLDVWGEGRSSVSQARAVQAGAQSGWHAARVLVAAELAQTYFSWRACHRLSALARDDLASRKASVAALERGRDVGLVAPSAVAQAHALLAQGSQEHARQTQQCDRLTKALVALTALPEARILAAVSPGQAADAVQGRWTQAEVPWPGVPEVPTAVLRQRPDVWQSQWNLAAAAQAVGVAQAQLWPSLSLSASWLRHDVRHADDLTTWSFGPLAVRVPLMGREALGARVDAAGAAYDAALSAYRGTLRRAVSEVEQALVAQDALERRQHEAGVAARSLHEVFLATEQGLRVGLVGVPELEDVRRQWLGARSAAVALELERLHAAVALYVALGGGFDAAQVRDMEKQ